MYKNLRYIRSENTVYLSPSINKWIMRIQCTGFILMAFFLQVSFAAIAQHITIAKKNASITEIFQEIRNQSGYDFSIPADQLKKAKLVNIDAKNMDLSEVLDLCFSGQPFTYVLKNQTVVVIDRKKSELIRLLQKPIEGKITDTAGAPLRGATVQIKGTAIRIQTDAYGKFKLNTVPEDAIMVITYVGYQTREIDLGATSGNIGNLFIMKQQSSSLTEVQVQASSGYQKLDPQKTTGSYAVVSAKEIQESPSLNIMEKLEGKVPGVRFDIRKNQIQIRGVNNYYTTSPPLIVIDGFPAIDQKLTTIRGSYSTGSNPNSPLQPETTGNPILSTLNSSDIESITFLKDAAAAAIWGSNAANGVIVIETKKGHKGSPVINLNSSISISAPAQIADLDVMSSADYIDLEKELFDKNFIADPTSYWKYSAVSDAVDWMFRAKNGLVTETQRDSALEALEGTSNRSQLQKLLLQRTVTQQYNLSLSGGGNNSSYHISTNYSKDQPVFKNNGSESYFVTANLNNDFLNKRITVGTLINYTYSKNQINNAAIQALSVGRLGLAPYQLLVDENGIPIQRGLSFTKHVSDSLANLGYMSWTYNPVDELNYSNTVFNKNAIRANLSVTGKVTDWLNVQVSGQLQRNISQESLLDNLKSLTTRELINYGTVIVNGKPSYGITSTPGGTYYTSNNNSEDYGLRGQLNIDKSWGTQHHFNMLAGAEIRQSQGRGYNQTRYGYDEETGSSQAVDYKTPYAYMFGGTKRLNYNDGSIFSNKTRYLSYFSTADYSYLNKYFLSGSIRFDDATMIGVDRSNRALPLWSAGIRWNLKGEGFLEGINWINSLDTRFTYGKSGSLPSGTNVNTVNIGLVDPYSQLPYTSLGSVANNNLGWSTTGTFNWGVDAAVFSNRLNVTFDIYKKHSEGIIVSLPFNSTYGISNLSYNTADLDGHGYEINLTGQIIRLKDWRWTSNFNISYNTNKVTDDRFPLTDANPGNRITTGYPVDNLFVYQWAGLNNQGRSQIYNAQGDKLTDVAYPTVKAEDLVYAGRTTPPYFGGFNNTFQYKNLSLSVRAVYSFGNKFLKKDLVQYPTSGQISGLIGTSKAMVNRWREPGDEAFTNVPGLSSTMNLNTVSFYSNSNLSVLDGSLIRLQQISLGYTLPSDWLKRTKVFKAASVTATVDNLGIIWRKNKEGIDPDYIMTSIYNNLPPSANYYLNFNFTF